MHGLCLSVVECEAFSTQGQKEPLKIRITDDVGSLVESGIRECEAELLAGNIIDAQRERGGAVRIGCTLDQFVRCGGLRLGWILLSEDFTIIEP
jgi:hypothetical protein